MRMQQRRRPARLRLSQTLSKKPKPSVCNSTRTKAGAKLWCNGGKPWLCGEAELDRLRADEASRMATFAIPASPP
jgi:hypothetical protein